jgi:hypothetical protein
VQFHPEIDLAIVKRWEADADNAFKESGKSSIQDEFARVEKELAEIWKPFIQRWGRAVLAS